MPLVLVASWLEGRSALWRDPRKGGSLPHCVGGPGAPLDLGAPLAHCKVGIGPEVIVSGPVGNAHHQDGATTGIRSHFEIRNRQGERG
ncbi:hypothetical protein [Azospirillum brasilense]|uniref:hypothetical protein n=1 Tax=Azospirillum brasilense TaxID=192 RepID=UPI001177C234|nr:hypothetical protein [Azospirillum brasilense]